MPNFLDLAPELRNNIYELSLHHDSANKRFANLSLLLVSKKISREARDFLVFRFTVVCEEFDSAGQIPAKIMTLKGEIDAFVDIYNPITRSVFPPALLHIRQIDISLQMGTTAPKCVHNYRLVGRLLSRLADHLAGARVRDGKQHIRISLLLGEEPPVGDEDFNRECIGMLRGLLRLRKKMDIELKGFGNVVEESFSDCLYPSYMRAPLQLLEGMKKVEGGSELK